MVITTDNHRRVHMRNIGTKRQFFFNHALLDLDKTTANVQVSDKPVRREKLMTFDELWENQKVSYPSFFYDEDVKKYRLYYCASMRKDLTKLNEQEMDEPHMRFCYAESEDGLNWVKPILGLYDVDGDFNNNVIIPAYAGNTFDNFFVYKDINPNCPPNERYKGVAYDTRGEITQRRSGMDSNRVLLYFKSADGIHFDIEPEVLDIEGRFDTHNVIMWNPEDELYHIYFRDVHAGYCFDYPDEVWVRDVYHATSKDFRNWNEAEELRYQDGAPAMQMYTSGVLPYYRGDGMWIGFPTRYFEHPQWIPNIDHLPALKERKDLFGAYSRCAVAFTDAGFMYSENKSDWYRFDEAYFLPGPENMDNWFYGDCYLAAGMYETINDFGEKELSVIMPISKWKRDGGFLTKYAEYYRYTMRIDGFACAHADGKGAGLLTKPFTFEGNKLEMNFRTSAGGFVKVALTDEDGNVLEGFEDVRLFGDSIERPVDFIGDLAALNGKVVRMQLQMRDADVFSFKFHN